MLGSLPEPERERFAEEYKERLRRAYPASEAGTVLPFRRAFAVATRI